MVGFDIMMITFYPNQTTDEILYQLMVKIQSVCR